MMRFTVQYPIVAAGYDRALLEPENVIAVARTVEEAGLDALAFTEHPVPSQKWMAAGGHDSLDPVTALAFCAAATTSIKLMPYLMVLPYRSPFLAAKQVATLDVLSGGRVVFGVGTGYLRSEFAALGVDHAERTRLFDEALETILGIWGTDGYSKTGMHFFAKAQTAHPRPRQQPHPPVWLGGNSARVRQRVADLGAGWAPLIIPAERAATVSTPAIENIAELRTAIADLNRRVEEAGRDPGSIDVQVEWAQINKMAGDRTRQLDLIAELADAGVTWLVVDPPGDDVEHTRDAIREYGAEVAAKS
ncbi:MAG TPA: TIGR03619 family F420-dependent LLM class oxidoreductase [Amycolatopsis sp.]|nr:TIGR03619 family F420-dependent LLM class oxidoreductase [Amycolatopsis sp.]